MKKERLVSRVSIRKGADGIAYVELIEEAGEQIDLEHFERDMRKLFKERAKIGKALVIASASLSLLSVLIGILSLAKAYTINLGVFVASTIFLISTIMFLLWYLRVLPGIKAYRRAVYATAGVEFMFGCVLLSISPSTITAFNVFLCPVLSLISGTLCTYFCASLKRFKKVSGMYKELSELKYKVFLKGKNNE